MRVELRCMSCGPSSIATAWLVAGSLMQMPRTFDGFVGHPSTCPDVHGALRAQLVQPADVVRKMFGEPVR